MCISLFLYIVKHLFVSSPKNIHTTLKQTAQESSTGSHLQVQVSSTIWKETSIQEARKSRGRGVEETQRGTGEEQQTGQG